jgi:hypothetical protein
MRDDVLNPVIPVKIRGETVEVRELTWKDYLRAIKEATGSVLKLMSESGATLELSKDKVVEVIGAQEELVSWVLEKSTGKDQAYISNLTALEMVRLLNAVVDLNLNEELVGAGKGLAGRMANVIGWKTASLRPLTTSSAPATTVSTSSK